MQSFPEQDTQFVVIVENFGNKFVYYYSTEALARAARLDALRSYYIQLLNPDDNWKLSLTNLDIEDWWDQYASEDVFFSIEERCTTEEVIPNLTMEPLDIFGYRPPKTPQKMPCKINQHRKMNQ